MALMVIQCGGDKCDRLLYVQVEVGETTLYCYKCHSAMIVKFSKEDEYEGDG